MSPLVLALLFQLRVITLDDAVHEAEAHQPQLEAARAQVEAAKARIDEAQAGLLPSVSGTASYSRSTANSAGRDVLVNGVDTGTGTGNSFTTYNSFNAGVNAGILLWDFNQTSGRRDAAEASADAQEQSALLTHLTVVLAVRQAFFAARADKDLVAVAHDALANQQKHLNQIQQFVTVGTHPEIDLAQARTDVANARVQVITAENNFAVAKAQLVQAMGLEIDSDDIDVGDNELPPVPGEEGKLAPLVDEAVKARPDIAALDQQIRAQDLTVEVTDKGELPSLRASVGATEGGQALDDLAWNFSGTISLSWNIWDGGATAGRTHEAEANLLVLKAQRDQLRQQVRFEVEQAHRAVRAALAAKQAAAEAESSSKDLLRLAEGRYQNGVGTVIELGDAQLAATQASAQRVQADYNVSTARAALLKALGRS